MNKSLLKYWIKFKAVAPYLMWIWGMCIVTYIVVNVFSKEAIASATAGYYVFAASFVSLVAVPFLYKFKTKK